MNNVIEAKENNRFSKDLTLIIKGILIVWLLFHHTLGSRHYIYDGSAISWISKILSARGGAVVAGFAFLSGFGLNETYKAWLAKRIRANLGDPSLKEKLAFAYSRALRLLVSLWIVYIIFVGAILVFKNPDFLRDSYTGPIALGVLKNLSGGLLPVHVGSVNKSWWFVRAILSFYILYPFVKCFDKKWAFTITLISFIVTIPVLDSPQNTHIFWYFQFFLGYYFSEASIFPRFIDKISDRILIIGSALFFAALNYIMIRFRSYPLFPLWGVGIIVFVYSIYRVVPAECLMWKPLRLLGKYSSDMYLIHVFVHGSLFPEIVFFSMNPIWILASDVLICLLLSWLLSIIKSKTGLNNRLSRLCPDKQ